MNKLEKLKKALQYAEKRLEESIEDDNPFDACYWNQQCIKLETQIKEMKK